MEMDSAHRNGRIAKNTLILYVRMFFLLLVSLYTSRVVLNVLGEDNYGIYNVVGGVVTMFTIISGSMSTAISRFLTFELGRDADKDRLKNVFATSIAVQLIIGVLIIVLAETLGVWFLNEKMNIAPERIGAAKWVFQLSLLTFLFNLLSIPYNAVIIAHERMTAFAYISIFEGLAKLAVAFLISSSPFDSLIYYALLTCAVAVMVRILYSIYCTRHFEEVRFRFTFDKSLFKEMFSFAGWNFIGNGVHILNTQGINVLFNLFYGVTVNAARGVVSQVEYAITQLVNNFTTAINPQITKSYAAGDKDYMFSLVCSGAKYSYFMMLLFAVPLIVEAEEILRMWLGIVPDYAPIFLRCSLLCSLCTVLSNTLVTAMFATGNIKRYQIVVGLVGLLVFPVTWGLFKLGMPPQTAYLVYFIVYGILLFVRLNLMRGMIGMTMTMYVRIVLFRILPVTLLAFALPCLFRFMLPSSFARLLLVLAASLFSTVGAIWLAGLDKSEKNTVITKIKSFISKS